MKSYRHLFGPVPSRRFGRSLGIDLVPYKTCSFDCIFCQLGHTTNKTIDRREYVPVGEVISEVHDWLEKDGKADFITFSGSGEPTLNSQIGRVIEAARSISKIPVAVLTNGTTLNVPSIRADIAKAHIVKISLSAWNQSSLEQINRPYQSVNMKEIIESFSTFRNEFEGELWIEVFLVPDINTGPEYVSQIAALVKTICPSRIQINTAVRPPTEDYVLTMPWEEMKKLAKLFTPPAEVIAEFSTALSPQFSANEDSILAMVERRPCTREQIELACGLHKNEIAKFLGTLMRNNKIHAGYRNGETYFSHCSKKPSNHVTV
jgi:wyosine [tRNA(Phe)-imidazoG37] synthetase (radical SAM superfamily)